MVTFYTKKKKKNSQYGGDRQKYTQTNRDIEIDSWVLSDTVELTNK